MNWQQHMTAAEKLLKDAEEEAAMAHTGDELMLARVHVQMAQVHAQLAQVKQVIK